MIISSGVGAMRSTNEPGSYSEYISSERRVISLRHFSNRQRSSAGAFLPVKNSHASALACEAVGDLVGAFRGEHGVDPLRAARASQPADPARRSHSSSVVTP